MAVLVGRRQREILRLERAFQHDFGLNPPLTKRLDNRLKRYVLSAP